MRRSSDIATFCAHFLADSPTCILLILLVWSDVPGGIGKAKSADVIKPLEGESCWSSTRLIFFRKQISTTLISGFRNSRHGSCIVLRKRNNGPGVVHSTSGSPRSIFLIAAPRADEEAVEMPEN